ncbi:MAG: ATP-binding protein, partial [Candidatus Heimdallarchaeota archaeon]
NAIRFVGTQLDITERKHAESELQESEEQFRLLFEKSQESEQQIKALVNNLAVGVGILQNNQVIYVNQSLSDIYGYSKEEMQNWTMEDIFRTTHPDDLEPNKQKFLKWKPKRKNLNILRVTHRLISKTNEIKWVDTFAQKLIYQGKESHISTVLDISDRKRAEGELRRQKTELSEFTHIMTHDLKNQLLSIEGYAEVLEFQYDKSYAKKIGQLAAHMNDLLRRSLLLADAGQIIEMAMEVALTQLVQAVAEGVVPKSVGFVLEDLPTVMGDPEKLSQVFQNLLENAVTHGSPTTIEVRRRDADDGTQILISNDGTPIPPEHRSKIFQQRFSTKKEGGGLGLAIVQKLVQAHSWQIQLAETPETTFTLFMPHKP